MTLHLKKSLSLILTILIFIFNSISASAQRPIPVNFSVFNEATALPFTKLITMPVHPGLQLGTEFNYREKASTRLFQTANLSYFYHNHLNQGIGIFSELGYEYRLKAGFGFTGLFGLGYMHTFATAEEFTFSNGQYEERADLGNARLFPSLSLDIGYYIKKESANSPKIFVRYQSWIEFPYSPGFIPVMTHINFHLGLKFFMLTNKTQQ